MKLLNRVLGCAGLAFLFTARSTCAAEMELLPGDLMRIRVGDEWRRVEVDVSSNLVNWVQFTNVVPSAGETTFVHRHHGDPARFFRLTPIVAPAGLEGLAFLIGDRRIQFTNGEYELVWNGFDSGAVDGARDRNTWTIVFGPYGDVPFMNTLRLDFATETNGSYTMQMFGELPVSGPMTKVLHVLWIT